MVAALCSPVDPRMSLVGNSRVCRLRGLPYSTTDEEIAKFFNDYTLDEVYICMRDGRATGEAYVMFCDAAQASSAMETCNKKYLGSRYIEMFEAAEADLAAVKKVLQNSHLQGCVVRLRGLPYTATAADVAAFFEGVQLADGDDAIVFTVTVDGRPTGECYVELADRDAQSAAMMRHKELMGSRYIEIFHSSKMDKLQAQQARLCMPPPTLGRWGMQPMRPSLAMPRAMNGWCDMQPDVLAAAAAAGNKLACEVDQLAGSLQGTHFNNTVARVLPPMQQQQQLYPQPYPQRQMPAQPLIVSLPGVTAGSIIDSSSNSSSIPSLSSSILSIPATTVAPVPAVPAADAAYYQLPIPAASAAVVSQPGGGVVRPAAAYMTPYGAAAAPAGGPVGPGEVPMQQQLPPHMYYVPMQQGSMPGPYGMPGPAYAMPPGHPAAAAAGPPRPMLVGGGQWVHSPAHWPAQSWPVSAAANSAALAMPACGIGAMQ